MYYGGHAEHAMGILVRGPLFSYSLFFLFLFFFFNLRNSPLHRSLPLGGLCPRIPYFSYIFYETPFFPEISLDKTRPRSGPHPLSAEARPLVYPALLDVPPRQTTYSSIGSTSTPGATAKLAAAAAASSAASDPPMAPDADVPGPG